MFEFKNYNYLTDNEIDLIIDEKVPEQPDKGYVPAYKYKIKLHKTDVIVGVIDIRIGYNEGIYYGGNIGYTVYEPYRGNYFAAKACRLIKQVAMAHDMNKLFITCNPDNCPSRRTCEVVGLKLVKIIDLPHDNNMYLEGERQKCIYLWVL